MDKLLLTIPEVCERLGVGRNTVYRLIGHGELGVVRFGKAVRIDSDDLRDLVDRLKEREPTSA